MIYFFAMTHAFGFVVELCIITCCFCFVPKALRNAVTRSGTYLRRGSASDMTAPDHDILVRALRGEVVHRPPVWLLRQVIFKSFSFEFIDGISTRLGDT
jgi:hypothetical protein